LNQLAVVPRDSTEVTGRSEAQCTRVLASLTHALDDGFTEMLYVLLPVWQAEFALDYVALAAQRPSMLASWPRSRYVCSSRSTSESADRPCAGHIAERGRLEGSLAPLPEGGGVVPSGVRGATWSRPSFFAIIMSIMP
jgi:hypothetical protein